MTIKQKIVARELVGNGGNITKAMLAAGYSPNTANTPQKLTESKGFKELLQQYLPIEDAFTATKEALVATRKRAEITDRDDKGRPIYEYYEEEDHQVRLKAAEQHYRLHGRYGDNVDPQAQGGLTVVYNFTNASRPNDPTGTGDNNRPPQVQSPQLAQESPQNDVRNGEIDPRSVK